MERTQAGISAKVLDEISTDRQRQPLEPRGNVLENDYSFNSLSCPADAK